MLLVIGVVLMAYSSVSNSLAQSSATNIISTYQEHISGLDSNAKEEMQTKIDEYNQKVSGEREVNITLEDDYENYEEYYNSVDINGLIGYISIPKINIYLPIYHGVSNSTLLKGIGHLKETSLPYGGESTHAALAGHTGLSKQKMFDDIDKLVEGDEFQIYILDKVLTYKVDKISIVDPNDVSQIQVEEGKDYVTLITCTPRLVNTHRLLVRGVRVPDKVAVAAETTHQDSEMDLDEDLIGWKTLLTSGTGKLSGAILHKAVFALRLACLVEVQKYLEVTLPIILDSPRGKEIDQENVNKMLNVIKCHFKDNQLIIASIYPYELDNLNMIELKNR